MADFWSEAGFWSDDYEPEEYTDDNVVIQEERDRFQDEEDEDWYNDLQDETPVVTSPVAEDVKRDPYLSSWIPSQPVRKTSDQARYAYNYLNEKGLPKHVSAGIVGNLMKESNLNPTIVEKGNTGNGRGIAQWDVRNRWKDLQTYAKQNNQDHTSLETQLDFVLHEARQRGDLQKTLGAKSPEEAAMIFGKTYERPNEKYADWNTRQANAASLYSMKFGGKAQYGDAFAVQNIPNQMLNGLDKNAIEQYLQDENYMPEYESLDNENLGGKLGAVGQIAGQVVNGVNKAKEIRSNLIQRASQYANQIIDVASETAAISNNAAQMRKFNQRKNNKQYQINRTSQNSPLIYT